MPGNITATTRLLILTAFFAASTFSISSFLMLMSILALFMAFEYYEEAYII